MGVEEAQGGDGKLKEDTEGGGGGEKLSVPTSVPFTKLLSYADAVDWILIALGTLGSVVHGMAQPVGYLLLGKALNSFGSNIGDVNLMVDALYKVVPFVWYMAIA
uniref:Uncharacterized protein n=1 Tax=Kalanchoe fedtschenkoi TaxID=63787 RepID=A0A7N0UQN6_KALFE